MASSYRKEQWNFERLTEIERTKAIALLNDEDLDGLFNLFKEKNVAPGNMKNCHFCGDMLELQNWTKWAIHTKKI